MRQCDAIRGLVRSHGLDEALVVAALQAGLSGGSIEWRSNSYGRIAQQYAQALWNNYVHRGRL
jgi:hypothetical protein